MAMHDDEFDIDDELVRALINQNVPTLGGRALRRLPTSGSTNALFRLGDDHLVRLPRQPGGSRAIDSEARWLPRLAPALPVAVPDVVALGQPGFGYPERWMVTDWIEGNRPRAPLPDGPDADAVARDLAAFVAALHAAAVPEEGADNPDLRSYRG